MSFYTGIRSPRSRALFIAHQVGARLHLPNSFLKLLRAGVGGRYSSDVMSLELRPGTWDAWTAHPGHEAETHAWIAGRFSGGTMIDVGAYCGSFLLRHVGQFTHIYAFEASSANYASLVRNIELSGASSKVTAIRAAVSSEPSMLKLYLSSEDTHSLIGSGAFEEVEAITLDAFWLRAGKPKISFIKIDVEGAEVQVLSGATELLRSGCTVLAEANGDAEAEVLCSLMARSGYLKGTVLDGRNYVFQPAWMEQ